MPQTRSNFSGRLALLLTILGLLLVLCVVLYFFITQRLSATVARMAAGEVSRDVVMAELSRIVAILLGAALAILAFAIGGYLLIGLGRAVSRPAASKEPTKYVDAWGQYRLSEAQIRAATEEEPPDPDNRPDDEPPNPNNRPDDEPPGAGGSISG